MLLRDTIRRNLRQFRQSMENDASDSLTQQLLLHFVYGPRTSDDRELNSLVSMLQLEPFLVGLLKDMPSPRFWTDLLVRFFTEPSAKLYTVIAKPSVEEADRIAKETREIVKKRVEEMGKEKLAMLEKRTEEAIERNDRPIPVEYIRAIPKPSITSLYLRSQGSCIINHGKIVSLVDGGKPAIESVLKWEANEVICR